MRLAGTTSNQAPFHHVAIRLPPLRYLAIILANNLLVLLQEWLILIEEQFDKKRTAHSRKRICEQSGGVLLCSHSWTYPRPCVGNG